MQVDFNYILEQVNRYKSLFEKAKSVEQRAVVLQSFSQKCHEFEKSANNVGEYLLKADISNLEGNK